MDYQAPDNIYWLFSSSAQAIAAFIGFLTAGFYFVLDKMDDQLKKDATLEEIHKEIKRLHFKKIKVLCVLTGASIIFSLVLVFTNKFDFCLKGLTTILVSLLNVTTISWAIYFIISIINPDNVSITAKKLIDEDKDLYSTEQNTLKDSVKITDFIDKFIKLEKLVRTFDFKNEVLSDYIVTNKISSIIDIINILFQRGYIDGRVYKDFKEVNKIRNLAVHGNIDSVDKKAYNTLKDLVTYFETYRKQ